MFHSTKLFTAAVLAALVAVPAVAQTSQQIRFQNNSGQTLQYLYASDSNNSSWEQDLLGQNVLRNGQYFDLTIHNVSNCMYDILMQFENGAELQDQINICQIGTYTIGR
jgi:hypothetical protein